MFVPSNQTLIITFQFLAWTAPIQIGVCLIILIFQVSAIRTLLHWYFLILFTARTFCTRGVCPFCGHGTPTRTRHGQAIPNSQKICKVHRPKGEDFARSLGYGLLLFSMIGWNNLKFQGLCVLWNIFHTRRHSSVVSFYDAPLSMNWCQALHRDLQN